MRHRVLPAAVTTASARPATPHEQGAAVARLFSHLTSAAAAQAAEELRAAAARGDLTLDGLFIAGPAECPTGACLSAVGEDRVCQVWPPVGDDAVTRESLLEAALANARSEGTAMSQMLLPQHHGEEGLLDGRMRHLTDLIFLTVDPSTGDPSLADVPDGATPDVAESGLTRFSYRPEADRPLFASLLVRTFDDSNDCPELNGLRSGEDALESHRLAGVFDPSLWHRYAVGGRDVGLTLVANHPPANSWEVAYLGLIPEARGRGFGRAVLRSVLRDAREAGVASVFTAADVRNAAAIGLYRGEGFLACDRQEVWVDIA